MKKHITRRVAESAKAEDKPYQIHDTIIPGFVLRVQPTGLKIWKLVQNHKPRTLGKMPTMTCAMAEAKALAILRGDESTSEPDPQTPESITFDQYIAEYYQPYVKTHHSRNKETLAALKAIVKPDTLLGDIKLADVELWRNIQNTRPTTINRKTATLKAALQRAVEWELLERNPIEHLKQLKTDKRKMVRYLSDAEASRLFSALATCTPKLRTLVTVALNTGLRRGELWNLTWADVNLKRDMLTVHGNGAKSGQTRHIPLNIIAKQAFKEYQLTGITPHPTLSIFGRHEFKRAFATLLKKAQITAFRFHDCRHTFASNLVMAGIPLNTVRELLGHASMEMTLIYAHLSPDDLKAAVDALAPRQTDDEKTA